MESPILTLRPSRPRVAAAAAVLSGAAFAMVWAAFADQDRSFGWQAVLVLAAALAAFGALRLLRLRTRTLILTETALTDTEAGVVCRIDEIARIDTGAFALKPARGLAIVLTAPATGAWVPGLWWRAGRRVGVGGMTAPQDTRLMADRLAALIDVRRAPRRPGSAARSGGSSRRSR